MCLDNARPCLLEQLREEDGWEKVSESYVFDWAHEHRFRRAVKFYVVAESIRMVNKEVARFSSIQGCK